MAAHSKETLEAGLRVGDNRLALLRVPMNALWQLLKHTQSSAFVSGGPPHASSSSEEEERRCSERQCVASVEAVDIANVHGLEGIGGGPDYLRAPRGFWSILSGPETAFGLSPIPV